MTQAKLQTRWRLLLGEDADDFVDIPLDEEQMKLDKALSDLYDANLDQSGGLAASKPHVGRWLGDIRKYFPKSVVRIMQKDAMERLHLDQLLLEPEILEELEPDVELVATILGLKNVIPSKTRATARKVVNQVVSKLQKRLKMPTYKALRGALNRSVRNRRPKAAEIHWHRTILKNLKHYQKQYNTIIPEQLHGYGRKSGKLKHVILCLDQSGSMSTSVVYASIFGAVMASIGAIKTTMLTFDTSVADLTEQLRDPVELLFGVNLGGGTDINQALAYVDNIVDKPQDTILILISDLMEGGDLNQMLGRAGKLKKDGVNMICLLALNDTGKPQFSSSNAASFAAMGIPSFACTPDQFPDLMADALQGRKLRMINSGQ